MQTALLFVLALVVPPSVEAPRPPAQFTLAGRVIDARRHGVGEAVTILLDARSGLPIMKRARQPFDIERERAGHHDVILSTLTDRAGRFEFRDLPAGEYRAIAQNWNPPPEQPFDENRLLEPHSARVILRGAANLRLPATDELVLSPLGTGEFRYHNPKSHGGLTLLLSAATPAGDSILGLYALRGSFARNVLAYNALPHNEDTVVSGLPDGKIGYAVLANDNVAGLDFGTVLLQESNGRRATASEKIVAAWSNGRHDPPAHLKALTDQLRQLIDTGHTTELATALGIERLDRSTFRLLLASEIPLSRLYRLPDGTQATLGEIAAAYSYVYLQRNHYGIRRDPVDSTNSPPDDTGVETAPDVPLD